MLTMDDYSLITYFKNEPIVLQCAELLINNGADLNAVDKNNETALDIAKRLHFKQMVNLLVGKIKEKGIDKQKYRRVE